MGDRQSDATLNPGGVRIGTAEIYRRSRPCPEVVESIVIGQQFRAMPGWCCSSNSLPGSTLDAALIDRIKQRIRRKTTPRHVPAKVVQVPDIPRTKSNKIVELAVRDVVHGRNVKNVDALANPEALRILPQQESWRTDRSCAATAPRMRLPPPIWAALYDGGFTTTATSSARPCGFTTFSRDCCWIWARAEFACLSTL